jgi:uncharacterized coiled-coil DUF342 family protein
LQTEIDDLTDHLDAEQGANQKIIKRLRETHEQEVEEFHSEIDEYKIRIRQVEKSSKEQIESLESQLQQRKQAGENLTETKEKLADQLQQLTQVKLVQLLFSFRKAADETKASMTKEISTLHSQIEAELEKRYQARLPVMTKYPDIKWNTNWNPRILNYRSKKRKQVYFKLNWRTHYYVIKQM